MPLSSSTLEFLGGLYSCHPLNLENFQLLFLQIFLYSFFSFFWTLTMCMLVHLIVSHRFLMLCFSSIFFLSIPQPQWVSLSYLKIHQLFILPAHVCLWIHLANFNFSYCPFQLQNLFWFLFSFLKNVFIDNSILFTHYCLDFIHMFLWFFEHL